MPWTSKDATKHNKAAKGQKAKQWAEVANSILKNTGDEARAIRGANAAIKPKQNKRTKPSKTEGI